MGIPSHKPPVPALVVAAQIRPRCGALLEVAGTPSGPTSPCFFTVQQERPGGDDESTQGASRRDLALMTAPTISHRTPALPRCRAQAGVISLTERGRLAVLLVKLNRQFPALEPWQQRHVTALLANPLVVYGRGSIA